MTVQCADGYDVATIASYDDINNLYNRFIFPTNVSMVINNFNMSGDNNFLVTINQRSAFWYHFVIYAGPSFAWRLNKENNKWQSDSKQNSLIQFYLKYNYSVNCSVYAYNIICVYIFKDFEQDAELVIVKKEE